MTSFFQIALMILDIARWIVLAHIIISWLVNFQVLNLRQPLVAQLWNGLNSLLEPVYSRLRRLLPQMGGIDIAPLLLLLGMQGLRIVLVNNSGLFF